MKKSAWLLFCVMSVWSVTAGSAETGGRTYGDPACSARNADPEKCILQDGPPRPAIAAGKTPPESRGGGTSPSAGSTGAASFGSKSGATGGLSAGGRNK